MSIEFTSLFGHFEPVSHFMRVKDTGRLHHAWLMEGPKGIGKKQAALNLAATVLGAPHQLDENTFSIAKHAVRDHIEAGSHPDFRLVQTPVDANGKSKTGIPVDDIRKLTTFFSLKPALGGYRVAIIDAMDDLNVSGANAILKTLEEPPADCLLFLIYHRQSGLLPTIRSRCQRLKFSKLTSDIMPKLLSVEGETDQIISEIIDLSDGSPGEAKTYLDANIEPLLAALNSLVKHEWPQIKSSSINRIMQYAAASETHFQFLLKYLDQNLLAMASQSDDFSSALSKTWVDIRTIAGHGTELKLDLTERVAKCLHALQLAARESGTPNAV